MQNVTSFISLYIVTIILNYGIHYIASTEMKKHYDFYEYPEIAMCLSFLSLLGTCTLVGVILGDLVHLESSLKWVHFKLWNRWLKIWDHSK